MTVFIFKVVQPMYSNYSKQKGFSLIEMLMTLAVFSVILLSLAYVQFQNTHATGDQYFEQVALKLIHNTYEQCQIICSDENLKKAAKEQLPEGDGEVFSDAEHIHIQVSWFDRFTHERRELNVDV